MADCGIGRKASVLAVLLVLAAAISLAHGSTDIDLASALRGEGPDGIILFSIRLPRVAAAMLSGLALAAAGCLIQTATGNDLASPNIIGMNSGAGFAVLLFLSFFPELFSLLPIAAFAGGLAAVSAVFLISSLTGGRTGKSSSLILAGIAVNALFNALISTLSSLDPDVMGSYSAFSIGGFASVRGSQLAIPGAIILASSAAALLLAGVMDAIMLGDELASSLGYRPGRIRITLVALAALLASSAVSFSGLLGFVGLVTPHLALHLSGGGSRRTLILSMLLGPLLVLLSDLLARTAVKPSELPAGVFMAVLGVPFFIFLLIRRARR